jgi:hypothetical protein
MPRLFRRTGTGVRFYVVALLVDDATQFAFHRLESVVNGLGERFVPAIVRLFLIGDELVAAGNRYVDANAEQVPLVMGVVRLLDGDVTPVDMVAKLLKPGRFFQNQQVDRLGFVDSTIGDVYWQLHNWHQV